MTDPTPTLTYRIVCHHEHGGQSDHAECVARIAAEQTELERTVARMVADAEARALREAADPIALDYATHFCGWRVLDHDMQPRPVDACKMPTAVALADWLRARADSLATQPADRCPTCGPGYHYGDDGCRHKPALEAATVSAWVRERVEAVWPDPFGEFTATEAAAAKLMKDAIRAALAERGDS